jgi:hypothetical protein
MRTNNTRAGLVRFQKKGARRYMKTKVGSRISYISAAGLFLSLSNPAAADTTELQQIEVKGRADDLTGIAESASQGRISHADFELRPLLRVAEVLEVVPGMLATQHSGTGKANQYFLRGFNLDHGTDFAASADGIPLNMPTHGHGQGYLDLNSVIPELVDYVEFGKGPYSAEVGDFSSAGHAQLHTKSRLDQGFVSVGVGQNNYLRMVGAKSVKAADGELLYAGEVQFYDGPWDEPEDLSKYNLLVKHTTGDRTHGRSVMASAYKSKWTATNQIPLRAVESGLISPLGTIDPSDGGESARYGMSAQWWGQTPGTATRATVYALYSDLNLFSNFTFFLDDPVNGDQIKQTDRRTVLGGEANRAWYGTLAGHETANTLGAQLRYDDIGEVGLFHTRAREILSTVRKDSVKEAALGVYAKNETRWSESVRTIVGLRADYYSFDVESNLAANSGAESEAILSPKLTVVFGPWNNTEYYLNYGYGFHSNDARGATITVDPSTGEPVERVDPLVRSKGAEVGLRGRWLPGWISTVSLWRLTLDSELLFVGDAGTTESIGKSRRTGIEWANFYRPVDWLTLEADLAFTNAELVDASTGSEVPNSVGRVISAGATVTWPQGYFASLRLRYFGDIPLTEDGSVRAGSTTLLNLEAGYRQKQWQLALEVLNLLDSDDSDISYYYASRLPGEPAEGIEDIHYHPVEPRTVRVVATIRF